MTRASETRPFATLLPRGILGPVSTSVVLSAGIGVMGFEERLEKAIQRGRRRGDENAREAEAKALGEEELKRLHSKYRLGLSEQIEDCLRQLAGHFPGFRFETIYGDRGWGAAASRDDIEIKRGQRSNYYSRLEMTIRPFSSLHILELTAKGTIRNREIFNRKHFEKLSEVDRDNFSELVDLWVLEYAELYCAKVSNG